MTSKRPRGKGKKKTAALLKKKGERSGDISKSTTFFSTCVSGTEEIIHSHLKKKSREKFDILQKENSLFVYESNYKLQDIRNLGFFTATYVLLQKIEKVSSIEDAIIQTDVSRIRRNTLGPYIGKGRDKFIVRCYEGSTTVSVDKDRLVKIEKRIANELEAVLFVPRPSLEFALFLREDGNAYFGMRISYPDPNSKYEKRNAGQLRSQVAHCMCLMSSPKPDDVLLDPFAGFGTIPLERSVMFPYKEIVLFEKDKEVMLKAGELLGGKQKIQRHAADFFNSSVRDIDKIVTEPPSVLQDENSGRFYIKMLDKFSEVLRTNGMAVILLDRSVELPKHASFRIQETADILVSGKKSRIYKLSKVD